MIANPSPELRLAPLFHRKTKQVYSRSKVTLGDCKEAQSVIFSKLPKIPFNDFGVTYSRLFNSIQGHFCSPSGLTRSNWQSTNLQLYDLLFSPQHQPLWFSYQLQTYLNFPYIPVSNLLQNRIIFLCSHSFLFLLLLQQCNGHVPPKTILTIQQGCIPFFGVEMESCHGYHVRQTSVFETFVMLDLYECMRKIRK